MGRAREEFDRKLFTLKLSELSRQMQIESVKSDRATARQGGGLDLIRMVDGQLAVLSKWLEGVDRICREVWQTQGKTVTPEFVRDILVPEAMTLIGARVGVTQSSIDNNAVRTNRDPHAARHSLAMKVNRLKPEVVNRYEIEARELEYKNAPDARLPQKLQSTGIIPGQFLGTRQPPPLYRPEPTQVPPNPYFPPIWGVAMGRASEEFDRQFGSEWQEFHNRFMQIANEEERIERAAPKDRLLRAYCDYKEHPEIFLEKGKPEQGRFCLLKAPETGLWMLSDGVNENFQERFRTLAARAGVTLGSPKGTDPEDFWLHRLYLDLRENNSDQLFAASNEGGVILRICEASATYCARVERKAVTGEKPLPTSQPVDQRENLGNGILKKKARIVEIERILNRAPLTEYRGQPVHGGQNSRLRLEEERQHLLIAVAELEKELERSTAPRAQSDDASAYAATEQRERLRATIYSPVAARRMETYLVSKSISQTDFAATVGTTDRTLRSFRKTGKVRRDIFKSIATHMGTTKEALLKE